jgi:hypothetical protein
MLSEISWFHKDEYHMFASFVELMGKQKKAKHKKTMA